MKIPKLLLMASKGKERKTRNRKMHSLPPLGYMPSFV